MRSHREVVGEAEVRAVATKEDPPCGGCEGGGTRRKGVGRTAIFLSFEKDAREIGWLRSHREVVGEAEVRAVAAKEDPPTGDARKERRGEGG